MQSAHKLLFLCLLNLCCPVKIMYNGLKSVAKRKGHMTLITFSVMNFCNWSCVVHTNTLIQSEARFCVIFEFIISMLVPGNEYGRCMTEAQRSTRFVFFLICFAFWFKTWLSNWEDIHILEHAYCMSMALHHADCMQPSGILLLCPSEDSFLEASRPHW